MVRIDAGKTNAALRALALAVLVVGLAAAGPDKRSTLTNVSLTEIGDATQLTFAADGAVSYKPVPSADGATVVVDVVGLSTLPKENELTSTAVKGMTTDCWTTDDGVPMTRITVNLATAANHWFEAGKNGFTLMVEPASDKAEKTGSDASLKAAATAAEEMSSTPAMPPSRTPLGKSSAWGEVTVEGGTVPPAVEPAAAEAPEAPAAEEATPEPTKNDEGWTVPALAKSQATPSELNNELTFSPEALHDQTRNADAGPRVSLDVQGADVRTVMRSLAEYSGSNIVVGKEVLGNVTVNLTEVPWVDALNTICTTQGLGWVEEGGIIRVETLENLRKEAVARSTADKQLEDLQPLSTQIVRAVYATAAELKPAIEKTLTQRGHCETDERTNSLVITDVSRRVTAAVEMVRHLDSRTPQIEITAKLVDVDARFTRDLGINWGLGQVHNTAQAASGEATIKAGSVVDPAADVKFGLVRSWGTINAMLQALEQDQKADIISNPRITTVNNREAKILVGRKIPLIVLDQAGNAVTQLTTIGITLRVTPHINDDNRITLDLHPEVSDLASQATVQGGIIINTSEADTRVIVDNAETAVIGGLIRSNIEHIKRGVPILKDIPILGYIFSGTSEVKEKRELLIFITPKIVTNWTQTG